MEKLPGIPGGLGRTGMVKDMDAGGAGGGTNPENGNPTEDAFANRAYYRTESLAIELITTAENPQELFRGVRQLEKQLEDASIPFSLSERYTPPRVLSVMYERADILRLTPQELLDEGFIKDYDPSTGIARPTKRKFASFAMSVDEKVNIIRDPYTGRRFEDVELIYNFGTKEKRAEMATAYERAIHELEARSIMDDHISLRLNLDFRDNLGGLVETLHSGRMPKFKSEHLEAIFNAPGISELGQNAENTRLGDQIEEAIFLNLIMLNSGTKARMEKFLDRPGAKYLITKLAKEQNMEPDEWKERYIGKVNEWVDDKNRLIVDDDSGPATWREEAKAGKRGILTKWANISAWGGKPSEFGADKEKEFIEGGIGTLVGSNEAAWLSATLMRVIGAYASEGYVALPNGKSLLPLGEGRYISGDDTGKFHTYMFHMKEGLKGRPSGLKDMIGRIPDMAMNLFDWSAVEMNDLPDNPDGTKQRRSIWDAWLGTAGEKAKLDLLTGQPTSETTTEEPYHRLGSLNFKSLERDFHGTFTIMQWLMGSDRTPTGVYTDAIRVDDLKMEDFTLNEQKKRVKYIGIVMNPVVLTKGSTHLYTNINKGVSEIRKNFLLNLTSARINSAAFALGILPSIEKVFNSSTGEVVEIPTAKIVEKWFNEVDTSIPETEEELISHYVDNSFEYRSLGIETKKVVGEIVERAQQNLERTKDKSGIVIGKNTW